MFDWTLTEGALNNMLSEFMDQRPACQHTSEQQFSVFRRLINLTFLDSVFLSIFTVIIMINLACISRKRSLYDQEVVIYLKTT